jgi:cytochrome c peroxidase
VLETATDRLKAEPAYREAFTTAFAAAPDTGISPRTIRVALAAYMRSLQRLDSRVDRALRGDTAQLTAEERVGFNVFAGKGACATCHFLPLTNGTVPVTFTRMEHEVLGVPSRPVWAKALVDADEGRARSTRAALHKYAFKTPTVRNAGVTAPYMHNGVYQTLDEVVRFYELGGGKGIGIDLPHQTLPFANLDLTPAESKALVAFMQAFTDTAGTSARPVPLRRQVVGR